LSAIQDLQPVLKRLRLSGVLQSLDVRVQQFVDDDMHPTEFLYRVLHDELERREAKARDTRQRKAKLPSTKTIENFDWTFDKSLPKNEVIDLATCTFIDKAENVFFVGKAGTGKSHLAQALGQRAIHAGYDTLFLDAQEMFSTLRAAHADDSTEKLLAKWSKPKLLIIDDFGLRPLRGREPEDFFDVVKARYQKASTVVTSNRSLDEWYPLFGDALLASAAIDRLTHGAHKLVLDGESYRNPKKNKK